MSEARAATGSDEASAGQRLLCWQAGWLAAWAVFCVLCHTMALIRRLLAAVVALLLVPSAESERSVLHIVVDDLGRADLGFRAANQNQSHTPQLNMMAREGVLLDSHYVFQVCAPTRASVLSGRYPWGIGFYYVGGDNLGLGVGYEILPQALRRLAKTQQSKDVATFAIGKWHCGSLLKRYTPTYRGFESFFGYCKRLHSTFSLAC